MARPQALQMLDHGKLLTRHNFPNFVDSWNYVANRCDNFRGDADVNSNYGHIKVDNSDPEHPVIRFVGDSFVPDDVSIGKDEENKIEIYGFKSQSEQTVVPTATDAPKYSFLTRYVPSTNLDDSELEYYSYNTILKSLPDDASLDSYEISTDFPKLCVKGWYDQATESATESTISSYDILARSGTTLKYITLNLSGGGGSEITLDDISISKDSSDKVEIKGFKSQASRTSGIGSGDAPKFSLLTRYANGSLSSSQLYYWDYNTVLKSLFDGNSLFFFNMATDSPKLCVKGWYDQSTVTADDTTVANYDFVARSGSNLQYVKLNLSGGGGGGGTTGLTTTVPVVNSVYWDNDTKQIVAKGKTLTFTDGVLTAISAESTFNTISTTPHTPDS